MQTIGHQQKNGRQKNGATLIATFAPQYPHARRMPALVAAALSVCFLAALVSIALTPSYAFAKSYTMPKVDIVANVGTDGSLNVVEQRTFDFSGDFSAVWWEFDGLPANASLQINAVSLTTAYGETTRLPEESFVLSWRDSGGPSKDAYSVDTPKDTVYVFFSAHDEQLTIALDYTIVNGAQAYKDVAELYWKYVGSQWAEDSHDVSMTLTLPVPERVVVTPGENVRAWGHGPLTGNLSFTSDGSLVYKVDRVSSGQFAEARVAFDVRWLTNVDKTAQVHRSENRLDVILREEQAWANQANRERMLALVSTIAFGLVSILTLLWAIRLFFKYGKEHNPAFTDPYWRDVPSSQDHPAVIARLWRWNKKSPNDFTATLMYLSHKGAILINKGSYEKPGLLGRPTLVDDYYLTRVPAVDATLTNPIDRSTMNWLFKKISKGANSLWFGSIEKYGKDNAKTFMEEMEAWQGLVTAEANKRDFFEVKGPAMQALMIAIATLLWVAGILVGILTMNFIPLFFTIPVAIALGFIASKMPRRSQEGSTLYAKCKALAKWLNDFSLLNERPPTDVKVWGELMVYAFIFGIAKQVIETLKLKVPELFQDGSMAGGATTAGSYVPWWFWYGSVYNAASGNMMPSASSMLQTAVNNTVHTAQAAVSGASGDFSGGGGGGGGFSGGGGGGFGGGGGAR